MPKRSRARKGGNISPLKSVAGAANRWLQDSRVISTVLGNVNPAAGLIAQSVGYGGRNQKGGFINAIFRPIGQIAKNVAFPVLGGISGGVNGAAGGILGGLNMMGSGRGQRGMGQVFPASGAPIAHNIMMKVNQ